MAEVTEAQRNAVKDAIFNGRKIEAVRLYREAAGCGLKDAKEFIERLTVEMSEREPGNFRVDPRKRAGCGVSTLLFAALTLWLAEKILHLLQIG